MDLIIIIVFIILILSCMLTAYVPYELQPLAKQAGFSKFSLRFCLLRIQKVPIKYLFEQYVRLIDSEISIEFEDFKKYWSAKPDKLENSIEIILNAKKAGIEIPINEIEKYNLNKNNALNFFSVLKKIETHKLPFSQTEIFNLINSDIDTDSYFTTLLNAQKHNIDITEQDINAINLNNINSYLSNLDKLKNTKQIPKLITESGYSWEIKNTLLTNLLLIKQSKLNITEDELIEIHKLGINSTDYIKASELLQTNNFENLTQDDIKEHFVKGGNSAAVLNALLFAKANNAEISSNLLFKIDLDQDSELEEIIKQAVIPYEINLPQTSATVLQDGIQINPKIVLSAKKNINTYSSYIDEKSYLTKINEFVSSELLKFKTYQGLLSNLKKFTDILLTQISLHEKKEVNIPFYISNVKIVDIDINADTLSKLKETQNKEKEEEAKLRLMDAKAKLQEDMSEALKNGSMSFKDYQKEKHIFGSFDNDELPYSD